MGAAKGVVLLSSQDSPGLGGEARELTPVANRPIISHAFRALSAAGISEAALVGRPGQLARVERALAADLSDRPSVHYIEQPPLGGALDALQLAEPFLEESPFVVQFADTLLREQLTSLVRALSSHPLDALVVLRKCFGSRPPVDLRGARLLSLLSNGRTTTSKLELAGFYLFGRGAAQAISDLGTGAGEQGLPAIVEGLVERGGHVETRCVEGCWSYHGDVDELLEANRFLLDGLTPSVPPESVRDSEIQGRAVIHPTADVSSAVIRGPAIVGAGAQIKKAYIGPYTSIGADVVVDGAELEHSIVLPGARITHLGVRLEGSVVGAGATVSGESRRPAGLRLHVGDRGEVSLG